MGFHHGADPIDMPRHDVPAQLIADPQRPFQVHQGAGMPVLQRGFRQRLGRNVDGEKIGADRDGGQAAAGAGDRGANGIFAVSAQACVPVGAAMTRRMARVRPAVRSREPGRGR